MEAKGTIIGHELDIDLERVNQNMSERCASRNRHGHRCGAWALTGATKCALHSDPRRASQLGSKHGCRGRVRLVIDAIHLPYKPLKTMCDMSELMEETINRVRQGSLDLRSANTIGFLASVHMKAIAEARNESLEDKTEEDGGLMYQSLFERMREGRVLSPQEDAYLKQEPSPLYAELRKQDSALAPESLPAPAELVEDRPTWPSAPNNGKPVITVEVG